MEFSPGLTNEEMFQIVTWHITGVPVSKIIRMYNQMFQNRPVLTRSVVERIMNNLREHGCYSVQGRIGRPPRPSNPEKELRDIMICAAKEKNANRSTRDLAEEFGLSRVRVAQILKDGGFVLSGKSFVKNKTKVQVKSGPQLKKINTEESRERVNDTIKTFDTITTEQMQESDYDSDDSLEQQISPMEENVFTKKIKNEILDNKDENYEDDIVNEDHLNRICICVSM